MRYYMAKRGMNMIFYPNGMRYLFRGELLTEGEIRKYGIDSMDDFDEVEVKKSETYKTRHQGLSCFNYDRRIGRYC